MTTVQYTRTGGRQLTYDIFANDRGWYTIRLGEKELMRGHDPLSADGMHRKPNKRKVAGAIHEATIAIERLSGMDEY